MMDKLVSLSAFCYNHGHIGGPLFIVSLLFTTPGAFQCWTTITYGFVCNFWCMQSIFSRPSQAITHHSLF